MTRAILGIALLLTTAVFLLESSPTSTPVAVLGCSALAFWAWGVGSLAKARGYSPILGATLGLLLNVVGLLLVMWLMPTKRRERP